jgi:hypothetical protein
MSIEGVNGKSIKSEIQSIAKSGDAGSRSGRIDILKQISELGKEILNAINTKDETLVEMEGGYEDLVKEMNDLQKEIDDAEERVESSNTKIEQIDEKIAELEEKAENGEELTDQEKRELEYYHKLRDVKTDNAKDADGKIKDLNGKLSGYNPKLKSYNDLLDDIMGTMDDYADAGIEIKDSAKTFGRSGMAENLEKDGGAMKRNESSWISLASMFGMKNDTEELVDRMGYRGLGDGGKNVDMTYHDDLAGGYVAEYDVMQYGIGGELRDLTAKTWSYGKTVNTAANDMEKRAEDVNKKRKDTEETE